MKHLKYFETEAEYNAYKNGSDFVLPNVSYIEEIDGLMFNADVAPASPNVVCTYNVTDISRETQILSSYGLPYMTSMIVAGVETDVDNYYQFDIIGNNVVEFVLDDPTRIGVDSLRDCSSLTSVIIPDSVTTIENSVFSGCSSLTSVYCKPTTPPVLGNTFVFYDNASDRKIYVPAESVDAYKSADRWSDYADAIVGYNF